MTDAYIHHYYALVASSIENEIHRDFFMSSRIIYAADIFAWLKDFGIEINNNLFHLKRAHSDL